MSHEFKKSDALFGSIHASRATDRAPEAGSGGVFRRLQFPSKKVVAITPLAPQIGMGASGSNEIPPRRGTAFRSCAVRPMSSARFLPVEGSKMKEQSPFCRQLSSAAAPSSPSSANPQLFGVTRRPAAPPNSFDLTRTKSTCVAVAIRGAGDAFFIHLRPATKSADAAATPAKACHRPQRPARTRSRGRAANRTR